MSIQDRVTKVVTQWSQVTDFGTSESLQVIWGQGPLKDSISFPTPALLNLITMLQHEFQSGKDARDLHGLSASRFKPATNGTIDTVDQLSSVVLYSPEGTGGPAMMALPMTADAHRFFVNSIADEVEKRLRPAKRATKKAAKKTAPSPTEKGR